MKESGEESFIEDAADIDARRMAMKEAEGSKVVLFKLVKLLVAVKLLP